MPSEEDNPTFSMTMLTKLRVLMEESGNVMYDSNASDNEQVLGATECYIPENNFVPSKGNVNQHFPLHGTFSSNCTINSCHLTSAPVDCSRTRFI